MARLRTLSASHLSCALAPVIFTAIGRPSLSVRIWRLEPNLPRSVGLGPVSLPPLGDFTLALSRDVHRSFSFFYYSIVELPCAFLQIHRILLEFEIFDDTLDQSQSILAKLSIGILFASYTKFQPKQLERGQEASLQVAWLFLQGLGA